MAPSGIPRLSGKQVHNPSSDSFNLMKTFYIFLKASDPGNEQWLGTGRHSLLSPSPPPPPPPHSDVDTNSVPEKVKCGCICRAWQVEAAGKVKRLGRQSGLCLGFMDPIPTWGGARLTHHRALLRTPAGLLQGRSGLSHHLSEQGPGSGGRRTFLTASVWSLKQHRLPAPGQHARSCPRALKHT